MQTIKKYKKVIASSLVLLILGVAFIVYFTNSESKSTNVVPDASVTDSTNVVGLGFNLRRTVPVTEKVDPGTQISVAVDIHVPIENQNTPNLNIAEVKFKYNPDLLQLDSIAAANSGFLVAGNAFDNTLGTGSFDLTKVGGTQFLEGEQIAVLKFTVKALDTSTTLNPNLEITADSKIGLPNAYFGLGTQLRISIKGKSIFGEACNVDTDCLDSVIGFKGVCNINKQCANPNCSTDTLPGVRGDCRNATSMCGQKCGNGFPLCQSGFECRLTSANQCMHEFAQGLCVPIETNDPSKGEGTGVIKDVKIDGFEIAVRSCNPGTTNTASKHLILWGAGSGDAYRELTQTDALSICAQTINSNPAPSCGKTCNTQADCGEDSGLTCNILTNKCISNNWVRECTNPGSNVQCDPNGCSYVIADPMPPMPPIESPICGKSCEFDSDCGDDRFICDANKLCTSTQWIRMCQTNPSPNVVCHPDGCDYTISDPAPTSFNDPLKEGGGNTGIVPPPRPPVEVVANSKIFGQQCTDSVECKPSTIGFKGICNQGKCVNPNCPTDTLYGTRGDCKTATRVCGQVCGGQYPLCGDGSVCRYKDGLYCGTTKGEGVCTPKGANADGSGLLANTYKELPVYIKQCPTVNVPFPDYNSFISANAEPGLNWTPELVTNHLCAVTTAEPGGGENTTSVPISCPQPSVQPDFCKLPGDKIVTTTDSNGCFNVKCVHQTECTPVPACGYANPPCPYAIQGVTYCEKVVDTTDVKLACVADIDKSGKLDAPDFAKFAASYKKPLANCSLDIVGNDCMYTIADLQMFGRAYNQVGLCAGSITTDEIQRARQSILKYGTARVEVTITPLSATFDMTNPIIIRDMQDKFISDFIKVTKVTMLQSTYFNVVRITLAPRVLVTINEQQLNALQNMPMVSKIVYKSVK